MNTVIYIGLAYALLTGIILINRKPRLLSYKIVILFMFFMILPMFFKLINPGVMIGENDIFGFVKAAPFTFGPFLYLYSLAEISESPRFRKSWLLHFIPFLIGAVLFVVYTGTEKFPHENPHPRPVHSFNDQQFDHHGLQPFHDDARMDMPPPPHGMEGDRLKPGDYREKISDGKPDYADKLLTAAIFISLAVYTFLVLLLLMRHRRNIIEYFSSVTIANNLNWLRWITICFFISYAFVIVMIQVKPDIMRYNLIRPNDIPDIATVFFMFCFSYFALSQPAIYRQLDTGSEPGKPDEDLKIEKKYEKSGLKDDSAEKFLNMLEDYMKNDKPYLDPDLTIFEVSSNINIPKHYITQIINEKMNKNFYRYINEYRINEVKQKISDKKFMDHPIIRIAYDSGFSSKSSFNKVFKEFTNLTPSEYRKNFTSSSSVPV